MRTSLLSCWSTESHAHSWPPGGMLQWPEPGTMIQAAALKTARNTEVKVQSTAEVDEPFGGESEATAAAVRARASIAPKSILTTADYFDAHRIGEQLDATLNQVACTLPQNPLAMLARLLPTDAHVPPLPTLPDVEAIQSLDELARRWATIHSCSAH
mmetsp:Transcript_53014/g.115688  ORF Transcript_53014/g.115688 Transcript_53014/m.115688 type:complete len:157 (-) Transcript_53014:549-1019(-)